MIGVLDHLEGEAPPCFSGLHADVKAARDTVAGAIGLRTSAGAKAEEALRVGLRAGPFRVLAIEPRSLVLGEDDKHLDFRVLLGLDDEDPPALTVTTLVCFHGRFGRVYFAGVRPFHRVIVRSMVAGVADALA